jgi:hypothetical protein
MATKFYTVAPMFVCPQYVTGFMSPFGAQPLELASAAVIFLENYFSPATKALHMSLFQTPRVARQSHVSDVVRG